MNQMPKNSVLENIEQVSGLTFVNIPSGIYTVGADDTQAKLVLVPEAREEHFPPTQVELSSFFISTDVVRLSHWKRLKTSKFAKALKGEISPEEIDLHNYNLVRDIKYGYDYSLQKFAKDRDEADPALTLTFSKSVQFAQILGTTLPNWAQWEVATRGAQAYLFPWGNEFDLNKVKLSQLHYRYTWEDPESVMGFRETEYISETKCRIDSFGEYESALSPFGLKGLARWGMEWNTTDQPLPNPEKYASITSHLLRSICDLGFSKTIVALSEQESENQQLRASNHRSFSGTSLPLFVDPKSGDKIAAFRLAYVIQQPEITAYPISETITVKGEEPDWELYEFLGEIEVELIDYLGEPEYTESQDFSTGSVWAEVGYLYYYSRGIRVKTNRCYSRIIPPKSIRKRVSWVEEIVFYTDTTDALGTRHEFFSYSRPVLEGVRLGMERQQVMAATGREDFRLAGIKVNFAFDRKDRLSRMVLTLDTVATDEKPGRRKKQIVPGSNIYKSFDCLRTLKGHFKSVNAIAISPDGQTFVSGSTDGTVKVWDMKTGQELCSLGRYPDRIAPVASVAVSQDGQYIVSFSTDKTLKVWNWQTGEQIHSLSHLEDIHCSNYAVAITASGQYIVSASKSRTIKVWDFKTGEIVHTLQARQSYPFVITPDGQYIVSASYNSMLAVWDIETGQEIRTINKAPYTASTLAISSDGQKIACGSDSDGTIKVWHFPTGEELFTLEGCSFFLPGINALAISPDGQTLIGGTNDCKIKVWDLGTGQQRGTLTGHSDSRAAAIAISPDGKTVISGFQDSTIHLWDLPARQKIPSPGGHTGSVYSIAISPDGQMLVSGSEDNTIKLWDLATGREISSLRGHSSLVRAVALSPDGETIASGSWDKTIKVWNVKTRREIRTLTGHLDSVNSVAISQDGKTLISGSKDNTIKVWTLPTGEEIFTISEPSFEIKFVAISPDGQTVASEVNHSIKVWDIKTGEEVSVFKGSSSGTNCLVFSPDGQVLISGNYNGTIAIYNWRARKKILTLKRHLGKVHSVAISVDGKTIVSGSADHSIKVWDVPKGKSIATLEGHSDEILSVAISQDGKYIASGSSDKSIKVWGVL